MSPFTRGTAISASYFSPDTVAVATDQGVAIATLADGESGSSKVNPLGDGIASSKGESSTQTLIPSNIPAGPIHTIISIGGVGNRPGILFVENHAVYSCRLGTIRAPNDHRQALVEKVDLHDPMMLCRLHGRKVPWRTTRSTRMSNFVESYQPMGCPPRLLSSPSGRYLCVYWEGEKTYEIQHAGSLLAREQSRAAATLALVRPVAGALEVHPVATQPGRAVGEEQFRALPPCPAMWQGLMTQYLKAPLVLKWKQWFPQPVLVKMR